MKETSNLKEVKIPDALASFIEDADIFHKKVNEATEKLNLYEKSLQQSCFVEGYIYIDKHQIKISYEIYSTSKKNSKLRLLVDDGELKRPIVESKAHMKLMCAEYLDELLQQLKINMSI